MTTLLPEEQGVPCPSLPAELGAHSPFSSSLPLAEATQWVFNSVLMNTISAKIIDLREELKRKFPGSVPLPALEAAQAVESRPRLPEVIKGGITEIVGDWLSSGIGLVQAFLIEESARCGQWMGLVDGRDAFDPWSIAPEALSKLLWVRCQEVKQAVRAADLLLRDGNLETVLLDLQPHSAREVFSVPSSSWHRLRMLAEKSGVALCVSTPCATVPCAASRLLLQHRFQIEDQETLRTRLLESVMTDVSFQSRPSVGQRLMAAAH